MGGTPLRGRVAAGLLLAASALALVLSTMPTPAAASATTLTLIAGSASVTRAGATAAAVDGDLVRPGDEIRTSADGHAVLTFVDGSTMTLEPGAALLIEEVTGRQGSSVVRVFQAVGLTWSSVTRLIAPESRFEVRTRSATASVRGTAFEVEVTPDGATRVRTSEGEVTVSNALGEVIVGEGAETRATPTAPPAPPSAPPPSTRRALEIGSRAVLIVDAAGRGCGRHEGKVVQQIPGCVVRDGSIEIQDAERVGAYRLAVTEDVGANTTVVERTVAAGSTAETVRTLELPAAELGAPPVQVASSGGTTFDVTLPLIGTIPVQVDLTTAAPVTGALSVPAPPTLSATASPDPVIPQVSLPAIPLSPTTATPSPSITAPSVGPTLVPTPVPTVAPKIAPTPTIAPLPTVSLLTPTPAPSPTPEPTPTPTPIITVPPLLTTSTPSPTPEPTPTPTPAPEPTPTPTASPTPTAAPPAAPPAAPSGVSAATALNVVTVTWLASTTIGVTYEVERSTNGGAYALRDSTGGLIFTESPGSGTHRYRVLAVADGVKSQPAVGNEVTVP